MRISELKGKKILILGFGREGQDSFLFLKKKFPNLSLAVADQKYIESPLLKGVKTHFGQDYLEFLKNYEIIIKSPGISPYVIAPFITKKQRVTSQTEIFFENCESTIIGVTGTKGKSTTSSLIYEVLKSGGLRVHLIGNIEKPVLQFLDRARPNDIFVYELSSFQLTNLKKSPHIAVFLNLYPEHLDYYAGNFAEYAKAKANIAKYQTETDFLIFNKKDPFITKIAKQSKAQKIPFAPTKLSLAKFNLAKLGLVVTSPEPAILIGKLFGISNSKIQNAIKNFKPLPHRLEKVGEYKGVTFYNDSLATIPEATIHAIELLGPKVKTLVAGGFDRGIAFEKLGKKIEQNNIKTLILFPTTGEKILQTMKNPPQHFLVSSMEEAVQLAYQYTPQGKICLLSPASSSFNMFKDYKDRGEQFKKFVMQYGKKK